MEIPFVLLVDDDSAILESFKIILEHEGYRVFTATNGLELKAQLAKKIPDLILMDYNLGEENSEMLTRELKGNSKTSNIPIIIISADAKFRALAISMGADDFIEKPTEITLLLSKIKNYVTRE